MTAWPGWERDVLGALGAAATPNAVTMLSVWHACEGGTADFNPMNTTQPEQGATNYNSVGVKNYPSQAVGLRATVTTIKNGYYPGILADLRSGSATPAQIVQRNAAEFSKWGTSVACLSSGTHATPISTAPKPKAHVPTTQLPSNPPGLTGPVGEANAIGAWHHLSRALGSTIPTQARRARHASRNFKHAIR